MSVSPWNFSGREQTALQRRVKVSTQTVISPSFVRKIWPGYPDDVPPFDELVEELELLIPDIVLTDIELNLTRLVTEVSKQGLPMVPDNVYPSGGRDRVQHSCHG